MIAEYDFLILGSGPIASSTAYFLTHTANSSTVGVVTEEPGETNHSATYKYAGGSIRWFWDDELKTEMTKRTADFIEDLLKQNVDLSAIKDHYLFLHRGVYVPSLNVSGAKLVEYFLDQAKAKGASVHENASIQAVEATANGVHVSTSQGEYFGKKALLALGSANANFMPGYELENEKRELFVLDLPVTASGQDFPHTILPVGEGIAYVFVKKLPSGLRFVVGQEDVLEVSDSLEPEDYFERLLDAGLGNIMPFLKSAHVENILWGVDVGNKVLKVADVNGKLFAANCGSSIRSAVYIGQTLCEKLQA